MDERCARGKCAVPEGRALSPRDPRCPRGARSTAEATTLPTANSSALIPEHQPLVDLVSRDIGALSNWFASVLPRGASMDQAIGEHEQTRAEILSEAINI